MTVVRKGTVRIAAPGNLPGFEAVDFNRDDFTALLKAKGYSITWEKAMFCPNRAVERPYPKAHDINCTVCDGRGWLYYDPIETQMLFTGMRMDQQFYAYGRWDAGQAMVTGLPEIHLNYWDRLTLGNSQVRFTELVQRGDTLLDQLKYMPLTVSNLTWVDRTKTLRSFTQNTEYVITDSGEVQWLDSASIPDTGDFYSIAYEYRPRYIVLDLVHHHRDQTVKGEHVDFPVQAVARLDFLIRDESKDAPQVVSENPFPR